MKKGNRGRILSRTSTVRKALLVSLARSFILKEKIQTTEAKAKEVAPFVEELITKAKKNNLAARRKLLLYFEPSLAGKMIEKIAPRYQERKGGFTRITKLAPRKSDGARMAILELV